MRHGRRVPKLGKAADQRKALLRSLTTELIRNGRIKTTETRAKAVRSEAERMVTLAKDGTLSARRRAMGYMYDKQLVHALFEQAPTATPIAMVAILGLCVQLLVVVTTLAWRSLSLPRWLSVCC